MVELLTKLVRLNIEFVSGDTFYWVFIFNQGETLSTVQPVSVANDTWKFTVKNGGSTLLEAASDGDPPYIFLDADGVTGAVAIVIPYSETAISIGSYTYDVEQTTEDGVRTTWFTGKFVVRPSYS